MIRRLIAWWKGTRISLEWGKDVDDKLKELHMPTVEIFKRSTALYHFCVMERRKGNRIFVEDGTRALREVTIV